MIVCHCEAVNDKAIRNEVACGARTVEEVARSCGAGDQCGACLPVVEQLLEQFGITPDREHVAA